MTNSHYRWVIVAAGGLLGCVAIGSMFSLPVFLLPISRDTGWSVTGVSSAMTIGFVAMALASLAWGSLSDRLGARVIAVIGSIVLSASLALASRATSLVEFQLLFGLLVGGSAAAIFAPMMACVTGWFDTHRSLAVSLVSAGMGMAPLTMAPFAAWLVSFTDWRTSLEIIAAVVAVVMIPAALLVRRPPALQAANTFAAASEPAPSEMTVRQAVRSPQFIVLLLTNFFCCATHSGPIFHTVSYAVSCGIPLIAAVSIYSVEGLAGMGGRIAFGVLGDRFGPKRVLVSGLLLQAFGALAYSFVRELAAFYAVAALFGFIYAGVMPLYAVLARENFPLRMMGAVIGGTAMAGSLGMATGPLAGGLIHDALGGYTWLYVGAWTIGLGAFLIALTFRPFPKARQPGLDGDGLDRRLAAAASTGG
jgi:MFS family permease